MNDTSTHKSEIARPDTPPSSGEVLQDLKLYLVLSNVVLTVLPIAASYLLPRYLY